MGGKAEKSSVAIVTTPFEAQDNANIANAVHHVAGGVGHGGH